MSSSFGLSSAGFCKKRLDDLVSQLEANFKAAYGANFKVTPETKQGQIIANLAAEFASLWNVAEDSYNAFNPNAAFGKALSDLVQYNSVLRQEATSSKVTLSLTGVDGTTIPAGSQAQVANTDTTFQTTTEAVISGGVAVAEAESVATGPVEAPAGTITDIFTPIAGWSTVTNAQDATLGLNRETDEELRARRNRSTGLNARNTVEAIQAQVEALDDVIQVLVLENDTDTDPDANGVPAHSVETIVQGGAEADIAEVLLRNKIPGIPYSGSTTIAGVEDSQGVPVTIKYTPPTVVDIQIQITLVKDSDYPTDGDDIIKQNIVDYAQGELVQGRGFFISDDVLLSELYTPINLVQGHYVSDLQISEVGNPLAAANVAISIRELAGFDIADITIL